MAVRSSAELRSILDLPPAGDAATDFPVLAPWPLIRRMRPGDPHDPLLLQVLSRDAEQRETPGYTSDPLHEAEASPQPGLIHKYHGRALLIVTGACALHCRYCFRREFPYAAHADGRLDAALAHLATQPDLGEIILSGGDPLSLDDDRLDVLLTRLEAIPHLHTLRIHTRYPIAIPARVTAALRARLAASRLRRVIVVHVNHAQEIDTDVRQALSELGDVATLLNQAVLLRDINDHVDTLAQLSQRLWSCGVLPYYLHQLDAVSGTAHFAVTDARARELHRGLQAVLPGYLLPRLVREIPGATSKTAL